MPGAGGSGGYPLTLGEHTNYACSCSVLQQCELLGVGAKVLIISETYKFFTKIFGSEEEISYICNDERHTAPMGRNVDEHRGILSTAAHVTAEANPRCSFCVLKYGGSAPATPDERHPALLAGISWLRFRGGDGYELDVWIILEW